jgi:hypothetical protein
MFLAHQPLQSTTKSLTVILLSIPYIHACCSYFQLSLSSHMPFFPKISFLYSWACFQQAPNTKMWLILSHLTSVCFIDLPGDRLELLHKLCFLHSSLCGILLECIQHLHCNLVVDHPFTFCLGVCHICFGFLFLCNDLCCMLLEWFHLSLTLLFLFLRSYEFFL